MYAHHDVVAEPLYVVTMISNPVRFQARWQLYKNFETMITQAGGILYTAELAYGTRAFAVTSPTNPRHLQIRTTDEIWHKENALNLLIQRLPSDAKYIAWVDADVTFSRPDWLTDTVQHLQHFDIVQMFSHTIDLDDNYHPVPGTLPHDKKPISPNELIGRIFAIKNKIFKSRGANYQSQGHPGYAWAARRSALDHLGGLIDFAILGAADQHMAHAYYGNVEASIAKGMHPSYIEALVQWGKRAADLKENIGYVPGLLQHHWHGPKKNRGYDWRWKILIKNNYNPLTDIRRDSNGVYHLNVHDRRTITLRDDIRAYFRQRNEDQLP